MTSQTSCQTHQDASVEAIHFYETITPDSIRNGKLKIPEKFVECYGERLPDLVFLKLSSGAEWPINLTKSGDEIWFEHGWKEFAEYYSLIYGHLLVFRYEGASSFHVLIFDNTAVEVKHRSDGIQDQENHIDKKGCQVNNDHKCQTPPVDGSDEVDDYIGSHCEQSVPQKRSGKPVLECLERCKKKTRNNASGEFQKGTEFHSISEGSGSKTFHGDVEANVFYQVQALISNERSRALDRAKAFNSRNPYFVMVMKPSYVHSKAKLHIPSWFAKNHLNVEQKQGVLVLRDQNGGDWDVKYTVRDINKMGRKFELKWRAFAVGNNVKVGDVCVFEFVGEDKIILKLHIFHVIDCPLPLSMIKGKI